MEIPANFVFRTDNVNLFNQMKEKTLRELENFEKRRKSGLEESLKKNLFFLSFFLQFSAVKSFKVLSNLFPPIISATPPK